MNEWTTNNQWTHEHINKQWTMNEQPMNEQPTTNRQPMNEQRPTTNNDHSNAHKRYLRAFSLRPDTRHPTEHKDAHKSQ